ncbi:MAG: nitronate monooxygenase, partial [Proteobacteria bacterium]|nr:nitronate monooxygenase [Pseudomonadota bacterium]
SDAGGIGIIQPMSMRFVHQHKVGDGIRYIRRLTDKPVGFNAIVEKTNRVFEDQMRGWIDTALEEGVRFFVTALGNPDWVVKKVHAVNGIVYHDITERKWAQKALDSGVDGLICVNGRAGGHAGQKDPRILFDELRDLDVPLICAGGIGDEQRFIEALETGYAGVQMGTRFIASEQCNAHHDYKAAIVRAQAEDIVHTEKISGVPVAVINTPYIEKTGTKAGRIGKRLLMHPRWKRHMRLLYSLKSVWQLRKASMQGMHYKDYFQAGKSVSGIKKVESAADIVERFAKAAKEAQI